MTSSPSAAPIRLMLVVIDDSHEVEIALNYACLRARRNGCRIGLLHVTVPPDLQAWMAVDRLIEEESRRDADRRINEFARRVNDLTGTLPVIYRRKGNRADEILSLLAEDASIAALVLGAAANSDNPGPLIRHLTTKGASRLRIPVTLVPGHLSLAELESLGPF